LGQMLLHIVQMHPTILANERNNVTDKRFEFSNLTSNILRTTISVNPMIQC
jgi:hypothetical protein